ncbi:MAG: hypothetical protein AB8B82_04095 [Roseovarius sp.]
MSDARPHSPARNRRFLVSIWLSEPGSNLSEQAISGVIWNADPAAVGQLDPGTRFETLQELPALMEALVAPSPAADPQTDAAP